MKAACFIHRSLRSRSSAVSLPYVLASQRRDASLSSSNGLVASFLGMDYRQSKLHQRFSADFLRAAELLQDFEMLRGCSAGKEQLRRCSEKRIISHKVRRRPDSLGIH